MPAGSRSYACRTLATPATASGRRRSAPPQQLSSCRLRVYKRYSMIKLSQLRDAQPRVVEALVSALQGGRLHHAYLLVGADLGASTLVAQALLASLACESRMGGDACGACRGCRRLEGGNHADASALVPDERGAIAIDTVRDLAKRLALRSSEDGATKVVSIVEADRLTMAAQNALLKTLEEPPGPTCFVLTTARPRALLATVRSRCQLLRLRPRTARGAMERLVAAGISEGLARLAAALVGDNVAAAETLLEAGGADLLAQLVTAVRSGQSLRALLDLAADVGADRERADLVLQLLEVLVRDLLAQAHGVPASAGYTGNEIVGAPLRRSDISAAAGRLQQLRRLRAVNINRTMAVESTLLALHGYGTRPIRAQGN